MEQRPLGDQPAGLRTFGRIFEIASYAMGQRGAITKPDSVRGMRKGVDYTDTPETPSAPAWLSEAAKTEFESLVVSLAAAGVPIKQVDAYALAMAAQCISSVAQWSALEQDANDLADRIECSKLIARYQRDSQSWLNMICATPTSRARLGLKSPNKEKSQLAKLLEAKAQTNEH